MIRRLLAACTLVALVATTGSLYFSEVLGLLPCELCWYQRILMYPLVVVLGVATFEGRAGVWKTGLPLSIPGGAIAAYHTYLQVAPATGSACTLGCGGVSWRGLGIFTIPRLSLVAFVLITVGLVAVAYLDTR
ncbi:MAG: disulfide bond formation protein B [Natrialbaceae archaeon]